MGNDLCVASGQAEFKIKCMQTCNAQDAQDRAKTQPIQLSEQASHRSRKYHDGEDIHQVSAEGLSVSKQEQKSPMVKRDKSTSNKMDSIKQNQVGSNLEKQPLKTTQFDCSSPMRKVKLDMKQLYLKHMNSNQQQGNIDNYQPIAVPFVVIKMSLNRKLSVSIENCHKEFFNNYKDDLQSFKLFKAGCYGHVLSEEYGIFLNNDYFYQGGFLRNGKGEFRPQNTGSYLTQTGQYLGQFKDGKPHGQGKYVQYNHVPNAFDSTQDSNLPTRGNKLQETTSEMQPKHNSTIAAPQTIYQGEWQNGQLTKGIIQNQQFKYTGSLQNRKPNGLGTLLIKTSNNTYKGQFKNGKFHGKNAIYQTSDYSYMGEFVDGKKNGPGLLLQKISSLKNNKGKLRNQEKYQGIWEQDRLKQRVSLVSLRKA